MSTEITPATEETTFLSQDRRKRRRSPEPPAPAPSQTLSTVIKSTEEETGTQSCQNPVSGPRLVSEEATAPHSVFQADQMESSDLEEAESRQSRSSDGYCSAEEESPDHSQDIESEDGTFKTTRSTENDFFTPPPSPTYSDEPIVFQSDYLTTLYSKKRSPSENTRDSPERGADGLTDAQRRFALLEEALYSDITREEEMELFFGNKRKPQKTQPDQSSVQAPILERQNSTSSSFLTEVTAEWPLRLSRRTCKGRQTACIGCESCTVSNRPKQAPRKRKNHA